MSVSSKRTNSKRTNIVLGRSFLGMRESGIAVVLLMLFGTSMSSPALAKGQISPKLAQNSPAARSITVLAKPATVLAKPAKISPTASLVALPDASPGALPSSNDISESEDLGKSVDRFIAAETSHLSHEEQQAIDALLQLKLEDDTLAALYDLSNAGSTNVELQAQLKNNSKLSQLPTDTASLKFSPAVFAAARLAGHMRSIGKAALLGNVIGAIRAADFDFSAMFSALTSGDTEEFSTLLTEALPRQTAFVEAISTGATFACNTATIDLTPGVCSRFSGFMRRTITKYQQPARR